MGLVFFLGTHVQGLIKTFARIGHAQTTFISRASLQKNGKDFNLLNLWKMAPRMVREARKISGCVRFSVSAFWPGVPTARARDTGHSITTVLLGPEHHDASLPVRVTVVSSLNRVALAARRRRPNAGRQRRGVPRRSSRQTRARRLRTGLGT